ncbi:MAG: endo-1,4-beta-xylanase [Nibricoccus sp.]
MKFTKELKNTLRYRRLFSVMLLGALTKYSISYASTKPLELKQQATVFFHIGVAMNQRQITGVDSEGVKLIKANFSSITPENALKWSELQPAPGEYDFSLADEYVNFGDKNGLFTIGHTLMWHNQTPPWIFQDSSGGEVSREELLRRLRAHIATVVGRYKGRIKGWDVVNEALNDENGQLRLEKPWYKILGEEGIFEAFKAAHEADPDAELYYNDYSLHNPVKRAAAIRLFKRIRERGLRIDGIGTQEHHLLTQPSIDEIDATFSEFEKEGIPVMVTELDVSVLPRPKNYQGAEISVSFKTSSELNPYVEGLPDSVSNALAARYDAIFSVYLKYQKSIRRVALWGATDGSSWLNHWPIRGRTDYPLLFDRNNLPKQAAFSVVDALKRAQSPADPGKQ